jgi:hypothetical protein
MNNKSGKFGKRKGDGYERELAKYLDQKLFGSTGQISRMPLSGGGSHLGGGGRADLLGTPTIWVEAKRTEKFSPYAAMAQAENGLIASKTKGEVPVVISRKNNTPTADSLVVMKLGDWIELYSEWLRACGYETYDEEEMHIQVTFDEPRIVPSVRDDKDEKVVQLFKPKNNEED